eukprot:TRINITY_DN22096_c0_g1_i1.p1 TRINITY_DN22096_c0_g1~~TRINITY_DN22096_c0_g1_i1.p1  ORF type:complete len:229 (-),score=32.04 TRINITY_DN22096_c0_g1_i1:39-725(-)
MPLIVVAGYGSGISDAVAELFGSKGYSLALLSRTQAKLDEAAKKLQEKYKVKARGYAVDLARTEEVRAVLGKIREELGAVGVLFWNPYGAAKAALEATPEDVQGSILLTVSNLLVAVQDLQEELGREKGAVLVTGGGLALDNRELAKVAVAWGAATLAISKAAQRKTVDVLHWTLQPKGVYVGEVTVLAPVKGTPFDSSGTSTLTPQAVAQAFWDLNEKRDEVFVSIK